MKPIAWTIAGSDSGGGAGIQADLKTFHDFNVHGCSVVTAVTAQNTATVNALEWVSPQLLDAQLASLQSDLHAQTVKTGMVSNPELIEIICNFLDQNPKTLVVDPVLVATSGDWLALPEAITLLRRELLPLASLVTPNWHEAETLSEFSITCEGDMLEAATLLKRAGAKAVLIKGGHGQGPLSQDYFSDENHSFWLNLHRYPWAKSHGSGCALSAAITSRLAHGDSIPEALTTAKLYVSRALRAALPLGKGAVILQPSSGNTFDYSPEDLPWVSSDGHFPTSFPKMLPEELGFYPLVDRANKCAELIEYGARTLQLRIKDLHGAELHREIKTATNFARANHARLFINDYWDLAMEYGAFGVHLGQEDLPKPDWRTLESSGIRLGISCHSLFEMAVAKSFGPSYVAIGPVFPTTLKMMRYAPQGLQRLQEWTRLSHVPVVAIGGISLERGSAVWECGVSGISVVSDLYTDTKRRVKAWLDLLNKGRKNHTGEPCEHHESKH